MIDAIYPTSHSRPIARYSPATLTPVSATHALLSISGQVAVDAEGATVGAGNARVQAEYVFDRIDALLDAAGATRAHLTSVVIYVANMADFAVISPVRDEYMPEPPPASTLVEVSRLAVEDHLVEISATAVVPRG